MGTKQLADNGSLEAVRLHTAWGVQVELWSTEPQQAAAGGERQGRAA